MPQPEHLDAYIFVHGATGQEIRRLQGLIDHDYMAQFNIVTPPPATGADADFGSMIRDEIRHDLSAVVRSVTLLAGPDDAVVAVTAASFEDLERLVFDKLHLITSNTKTAVSLYPPALHPAPPPLGGGAPAKKSTAKKSTAKKSTAKKSTRRRATARHHLEFPPISGGSRHLGQTWADDTIYSAVISISVIPGNPTPKDVVNNLADKFVPGGLYRGASVVAGEMNVLTMLGSNDYATLRDALANDLPRIKGMASYSIALNFRRPPQ